jgi:hypothetical protein
MKHQVLVLVVLLGACDGSVASDGLDDPLRGGKPRNQAAPTDLSAPPTPPPDFATTQVDAGTTPPPPTDLVCNSTPLNCGAVGVAMVNAGSPANRVNYVIVGDGYSQADLSAGIYESHLNAMLTYRFSSTADPYLRYRNFVNICALSAVSQTSGIGSSPGNTAFQGYGNDASRLGYANQSLVDSFISANIPASLLVDWKSVVLNDSSWWNAGGSTMVWSGGHPEAGGAALHEGGHAFHGLGDEYGGSGTNCNSEPWQINLTHDPVRTANKWSQWLGYTQAGLTGLQSTFDGGLFCAAGQGIWRPSDNSVMNMLFQAYAPTNVFNSVSREKVIRDLYAFVSPVDCATDTRSTLSNPLRIQVNVVDPAVIKVDWSVDGVVVSTNGGGIFDVGGERLASGSHTITARAYDDTDMVRGDRTALERTLTWSISVP